MSVTEPDKALAKQLILAIIYQFGGQPVSSRKLHHAFYIAHLYYFGDQSGLLTDWPMVKGPDGPKIELAQTLIEELVQEGALKQKPETVGPFRTVCYQPTGVRPAESNLSEAETAAVVAAVEFVGPRSDSELSALIAELARSWRTAAMGERLNIFPDVIPEEEYSRREKELKILEEHINQVELGHVEQAPQSFIVSPS